MDILTFLQKPWPWYVAGPLIAATMFLLLFYGKKFGLSSNLRSMCTIAGAGRKVEFFRFDVKAQRWNLLFIFGAILGGVISSVWLQDSAPIVVAEQTAAELKGLGFTEIGSRMLPNELFSAKGLASAKGLILLLGGGLLVGFGGRYAGGCTSGHGISGLSNLQLPSLIAVIGFFIGGLIMTHLLFPFLFAV